MSARGRMAGRPLVAVLALLSGWVAIRASMWEPPFPLASPEALFAQAQTDERGLAKAQTRAGLSATHPAAASLSSPLRNSALASAGGPDALRAAGIGPANFVSAAMVQSRSASFAQLARSRGSASQQMLFAAAYTALPTYRALMRTGLTEAASGPPGLGRGRWPFDEMVAAPAARVAGRSNAERGPGRWSADAWLLVREGDQGTRLASIDPASYGSDQVGAVLRYALAPDSLFDPQAYARASKALVRDGEGEVAGGLSVRLARRVPVRLHGEVRVTDRPGNTGRRTEVRPAAFVATGLPRQEIGPGIEADAYLQAGYVGGEFDTGFVDGRAVVEAPVIRDETRRFALGGGVWGGAQRDVSRLDAGPTASLSLSTGGASVRASADYRVRIAGDATPGDGPAVTLAVSF